MRYYSIQRLSWPGTFPRQDRPESIINFGEPAPTLEGICWYPVTVSSHKHGGGLQVTSGQPIRAVDRPEDAKGDTPKIEYKTRYFKVEEAQRVASVLRSLDITTKRVRMSVTQGECRVYINGKYILNFGDKIVLPEHGANPEDYYGDDIGGWRSSEPDSAFTLGLIWHPYDYIYQYSGQICKALGITQEEWVEDNYWNRRDKLWKD